MSIFASRTQQVLPLPFDEPHTVTIQKLAGRMLEKARQVNQQASVDALRRMGGATFQRELGAVGDPAVVAAAVAKRQADPLHTYDRYVVLAKGITAWTYDEALTPVEVVDEDGTKTLRIAAIDDLDEEAADFIARAIMALTRPARDEAEKKTD